MDRTLKIDQNELLFSKADLKKLIFPLLIEQLLTVTVGVADSVMVASVGEAAVSAVFVYQYGVFD